MDCMAQSTIQGIVRYSESSVKLLKFYKPFFLQPRTVLHTLRRLLVREGMLGLRLVEHLEHKPIDNLAPVLT
jgi:hypothetical protein